MENTGVLELEMSTFYLNGLGCANCAAKIESAINEESTYSDVSFSFATKKLKLKSNKDVKLLKSEIQSIVDGIEDGVIVSESRPNSSVNYCDGQSCSAEEHYVHSQNNIFSKSKTINTINIMLKQNYLVVIGSILVFALILIKPASNITLAGHIIAYILIGKDVVARAIRNLVKGNLFDEYFLMSIATFGAFAIGEYTEAVMVMLFYKVGEGFQTYAVDYSRRSIQSLLNIKAEFANIVSDGSTKKVTPESLIVGDTIIIKAGEKVPVDSLVLEGRSTLDTSALTGESLPREVVEGDEILSGSINNDAILKVKVTSSYENSTVAKILDMVENATSKKAKTEQFITKFAKIYTPIVVISALLLAFVPSLLGIGEFREWLSRALIFLVISCPCALVLSVPLGYFGGIGMASRQGILIKGGNYLEALNSIDTFVFDKTGTLTKGNFKVQKVTGERTLELAAILEAHSNHPIASSILEAHDKEVVLDNIKDVIEQRGEGLYGTYQGCQLLAGNERLMNRFGIEVDEDKHIGSVVYVAYDQKYVGAIHISDEIKTGGHSLASDLKSKGAKLLVMLTGDQDIIAESVAKELNLDEYHSELLPQDKMMYVENYINAGKKVLFVGDGINDAPVLARADIGVAMGGLGSDAAIEAADIVLMTDEPNKLIEAKEIAKKTREIVLQNIFFALGVKAFFLVLGSIGIATMYEAIFADVGVAIIAVLNSMRILKVK